MAYPSGTGLRAATKSEGSGSTSAAWRARHKYRDISSVLLSDSALTPVQFPPSLCLEELDGQFFTLSRFSCVHQSQHNPKHQAPLLDSPEVMIEEPNNQKTKERKNQGIALN
ncbi:MAG: hypothetical protein A3E92_03175 [Candidatus Taylorbacteria bacterium RIFCSPHIGHO2_12_FULL_42_34]|nr:MAG: hypothetical protein A3E92_03175 [Candidatus Taylorbacteria bacterium RIFCSPHIGHO2_12_FULL_42_34]